MASYTEHLELLKKNPVADGADTFNIQTMLNDNWEKIDAAVAGKADLGEDGKVIPAQMPAMNYDPAGSAAAVQANLAAHMADKNNPHGLDANDVGARPNTWVPAWGDVTGKPSAFPPSGHTHDASQITSGILSAARGGTGVGSIAELAALLGGQGLARIGFGYYIGTGTTSEDNPITLQFPVAPKAVWIYAMINGTLQSSPYRESTYYYHTQILNLDYMQTVFTQNCGFGERANTGSTYPVGKKSEDGKSVSFYNGGLSTNGYTYLYMYFY